MRRLDEGYLARIKRDKKILLFAVVHTKEISHINFLKTFFHNIAFTNRNHVFSYLDAIEDESFLKFFNLNDKDLPKVVIYDFSRGKYFIDNYSYLNDENAMTKLSALIKSIEDDEIRWTSGYVLEDFLNQIGLNVPRNVMLVVFLFVFIMICFVLIILLCSVMERFSVADKKRKKE